MKKLFEVRYCKIFINKSFFVYLSILNLVNDFIQWTLFNWLICFNLNENLSFLTPLIIYFFSLCSLYLIIMKIYTYITQIITISKKKILYVVSNIFIYFRAVFSKTNFNIFFTLIYEVWSYRYNYNHISVILNININYTLSF